MQFYREEVRRERSGRHLRAQELARRLANRLHKPASSLLEICRELDEAAEFAALGGITIGESLREYLAGRSGPESQELARMIGSVSCAGPRLPVLPIAVSRLLRTHADNVSISELERIAASDPVLTGRLLGGANSVLFGSRSHIVNVRDAVMRVGVPEARRILVAACLGGLFASSKLQEIWRHSHSVAQAACDIATQAEIDKEAAWVAGLLHDIGRVALASCSGEEASWVASGFPLVYAEALVYATGHAEIGASILEQWELPAEIVDAVRFHHRPECSDARLTAAVCLAEDRAASRPGGMHEDLWSNLRREMAYERMGIDTEEGGAAGNVRRASVCA